MLITSRCGGTITVHCLVAIKAARWREIVEALRRRLRSKWRRPGQRPEQLVRSYAYGAAQPSSSRQDINVRQRYSSVAAVRPPIRLTPRLEYLPISLFGGIIKG